MQHLIIRHGFTGVKRDDRKLYGLEGPPLNETGIKQSLDLRQELLQRGVNLAKASVAVSELLRTRLTAEHAGFVNITVNSVLNEINTGMKNMELKAFLQTQSLPEVVLQCARAILDKPPQENIWITHGLVIMGLRQLLDLPSDPFDPPNCSITLIDIGI